MPKLHICHDISDDRADCYAAYVIIEYKNIIKSWITNTQLGINTRDITVWVCNTLLNVFTKQVLSSTKINNAVINYNYTRNKGVTFCVEINQGDAFDPWINE